MIQTLEENLTTEGADSKGDRASAPRINIPVNLAAWKLLDAKVQEELAWFHGYILANCRSLKEAGGLIKYEKTTIWRVLKGTYEGNWAEIAEAIVKFRKDMGRAETVQASQFVHNRFTKYVFGGLSFALKNHSITMIIGESRRGKTMSGLAWCAENNHGKSVFVTAPAYGGTRALILRIAKAVGVGTSGKSTAEIWEDVFKAFNENRILIIDEAHRLIGNVRTLEMLRDLHDATGMALAFLATARFDTELQKSHYMFEQILGRILLPVRLPKKVRVTDIEGIVRQYISRPSESAMAEALSIANALGSIGILVSILRIGARIASKADRTMANDDFFRAIKIRKEMMGLSEEEEKE